MEVKSHLCHLFCLEINAHELFDPTVDLWISISEPQCLTNTMGTLTPTTELRASTHCVPVTALPRGLCIYFDESGFITTTVFTDVATGTQRG